MAFARRIDGTPKRLDPKPMQVLCFGMSRTGTLTMMTAFQKLGLNAYHMLHALTRRHEGHLQFWQEAIQAKYDGVGRTFTRRDFDKFLGDYESLADIPSLFFVDELLEAYPDAKVVLMDRSEDSWVKSMEATIYEILSWRTTAVMRRIDSGLWRPYIPFLERMLYIWTDGEPQDREALRRGFRKHYAHVRSVVPKEKILEFKLKDGWKPLCEFLGKEVPNEPFPHVNEGKWLTRFHFYYVVPRSLWLLLKRWIWNLSPLWILAGAMWWYTRR